MASSPLRILAVINWLRITPFITLARSLTAQVGLRVEPDPTHPVSVGAAPRPYFLQTYVLDRMRG
jgi:hypothetical protein